MKTSIKLLIGITVALVLTMVGAGWSFRQQYDKLDHTDPYAQFHTQVLPAFRVLKLVGSPGRVFLVQPGRRSVLRVDASYQSDVIAQLIGDTLLVRYRPPIATLDDDHGISAGAALPGRPIVVLSVPVLQTLLVEKATCKLSNWNVASLTLSQTGPNGATALDQTAIETLQATVSGGSLLTMAGKNTIGRATVTVSGKACFVVGTTTFSVLRLRVDSTATVQVPGALLARIK